MVPDGQPRGPEPALRNPCPGRSTRLLGGRLDENRWGAGWQLTLDPGNIGVGEGWAQSGLPGSTLTAEVPGVWNTEAPGYAGVAWYEVPFESPPPIGGTWRVVVGSANYLTDAWLNGVYLGRHEGGYDAFSFRCTHALRDRENRLILRIVDPPPDREIDGLRLRECPTGKESWYGGYGGPWGGVWLERSSQVWIEDVRVHGDLPGQRTTFDVTLAGDLPKSETVRLVVRVRDRRSHVAADPEAGIVGEASTPILVGPDGAVASLTVPVPAPRPWSPESPTTYDWQVTVERTGEDPPDSVLGRVGFRTCEWRDGVIYLNGEPRYLKGALLQPTYPRTLALPTRAGRLDDLRYADIATAKDTGLNLIRFHLRPPARGVLETCNYRGIMAYVEPPLAWIEPSGRLLEHGKRELAAMVRACGNHPSVVMWGIFNENAKATEAVGGELIAELARLDPTRPIIENSGGAAVGETGMWAWGGQSRCWSPGWEAPRPLNDVHVYLANPLRREARTLMTTLGDRPTLDVTPGRRPNERIESRLSADAVLVSEYGCGALPDFDAALAAFGDEQQLADATLLRDLRDDLARGLEASGLDREIGDIPSLVRQTQALQAEGILAQTAALRRNPHVSGLILTQLADAGWEQMAGLVGYWRHPRPALAAFKRALQPRLLHVELDDPCSVDAIRVRAALIEEPGLPPLHEPAVLAWTAETAGAPPFRGRFLDATRRDEGRREDLDIGPPGRPLAPPSEWSGPARLAARSLDAASTLSDTSTEPPDDRPTPGEREEPTPERGAPLPPAPSPVRRRGGEGSAVGEALAGRIWLRQPDAPGKLRGRDVRLRMPTAPGLYRVRARLTTDGWQDEAACMARRLPDRPPEAGAGVVLLGNGLRPSLPEASPDVPADWIGPILAYLPSRPTVASLKLAVERARAGAHLCLVGLDPASAQRIERLTGLPLGMHSGRGNFMGVHHYVREHPVFAGLGAPCLADSTFAEVLPAWVAEEIPGAEVLAGCFTVPDGGRGFLWRASLQTLPLGHGRLTVCQLRLGQRHGGALGAYLLDSLLAWVCESPTP